MRFLFLFFFFSSQLLYAHNPNEINYKITIDKDIQELLIDFTPKAAIDLLEQLQPHLKKESIIRPEDYLDSFVKYFNKTINIKIGDELMQFHLIDNSLRGHDAFLRFEIDDKVDVSFNKIEIEINSYTDIYRRVRNELKLDFYGTKFYALLSKENLSCVFRVNTKDSAERDMLSQKEHLPSYFYFIVVVIGLVAFLFSLYKNRRT